MTRVAWLLPGGVLWADGVRPGDRVLALNGRAPTPHDAGTWAGGHVLVRTAIAGTVSVEAAAVRRAHDTRTLLALSPWFLLFGTLVLLGAARPALGRATYALFASAAVALALAPAADADHLGANVVELTVVPLLATSFVLFFLTFPVRRGGFKLRAALAPPPFAATTLSLIALFWPGMYDGASLMYLAVVLAYLLLGAGLVVFAFATVDEHEEHRKLTIITIGTLASVLPFIALSLAPTLLHQPMLMGTEQTMYALVLLPASFAYAFLRHRTLNVHLVQRWLAYGLLWGALVVLYAAALYVLRRLPAATLPEPGRSLAFAVVLVALVGVSFNWLRDRLQRLIDRVIFRDSYDYRSALQGLSKDLSLIGDLDNLDTSFAATLRHMMNLDFTVLLVHDEQRSSARGASGGFRPAMLPALVEATRDVRDAPRVVPLAYGYLTVLLVPLRTHDALVGHLCLGPKASGEPFRAADQALLATLSGHLAAIVRNAQLVGDLHAQVTTLDALNERLQRVHEQERARLAADLHDEPLQTALSLQRQLTIDGHNPAATAHHVALSQTVCAQLRALCTAMRPAALDHLGLHAALDQLARECTKRTGIPILVDADPEIVELDLPPASQLVLYRASQEALNNCLRHAQPRTVRICLQRHAAGVQLQVDDDGVGFTVPTRLDALVSEGHLGLAGMQERVQHAGGRLRVTSAPGEGTVVQVHLPLEAAPV